MDQIKIGKFIAECRKKAGAYPDAAWRKAWNNRPSDIKMGKRKITSRFLFNAGAVPHT